MLNQTTVTSRKSIPVPVKIIDFDSIDKTSVQREIQDDTQPIISSAALDSFQRSNRYYFFNSKISESLDDLTPSFTPEILEFTEILELIYASQKHYRLFRDLDSFKALSDGWNGPFSKATTMHSINRACQLIIDILCRISNDNIHNVKYFSVCPTNEGGIQFELGNGKRDLDIEIEPDEVFLSVMKISHEEKQTRTDEFLIPIEKLGDLLTWLINR